MLGLDSFGKAVYRLESTDINNIVEAVCFIMKMEVIMSNIDGTVKASGFSGSDEVRCRKQLEKASAISVN